MLQTRRRGPILTFISLSLAIAAPAVAQQDTEPASEGPASELTRLEEAGVFAPMDWTLQVEAAAWSVSVGGDIGLGGDGVIDLDHLHGDDPNLSPFLELLFRQDDLTLSASVFNIGVSESATADRTLATDGLTIAPGERADLDLDLFSAEFSVGKRLWERPIAFRGEGPPRGVGLALHGYAGARFWSADLELETPTDNVSGSTVMAHPIIGARVEAEIFKAFSLDLALDGGWLRVGDREASSVSVMVGFRWFPAENLALQIGFRQIFFDLEDDDILLDGSMGGLMFGGTLRF